MDAHQQRAERAIAIIGAEFCSDAAATDYIASLLTQTYLEGRLAGIEDCQTIFGNQKEKR